MFAVCANPSWIRRSAKPYGLRVSKPAARDRAIFADCRNEAEFFLIKDKNTKAKKRRAFKTKLLSGEKGGPSDLSDGG